MFTLQTKHASYKHTEQGYLFCVGLSLLLSDVRVNLSWGMSHDWFGEKAVDANTCPELLTATTLHLNPL